MLIWAFEGFDVVAAVAQEVKDPRRNIPLGMATSMAIVFPLYIFTAVCLVGTVSPYTRLDDTDPFDLAITDIASKNPHLHLDWFNLCIAFGASIGMFSVAFGGSVSSSRLVYNFATDSLLPPFFKRIHPRWQTPWVATLLTTSIQMILSMLFSVDTLVSVVSMGTLTGFISSALSVTILRRKFPERERPFRVWGGAYLIPSICILFSVALMANAQSLAFTVYFCWLSVGLGVYVVYSKIKYKQL
jgi:APA family basic amino acid/polyamine antiporter